MLTCVAVFSSEAPLQDDNTTASIKLAVVRTTGISSSRSWESDRWVDQEIPPGGPTPAYCRRRRTSRPRAARARPAAGAPKGSAVQPLPLELLGWTLTVRAAVDWLHAGVPRSGDTSLAVSWMV